MDNVTLIIVAIVLVIALPIFYLISKNKGRMPDSESRDFDPNHRKHKHKPKKHKNHWFIKYTKEHILYFENFDVYCIYWDEIDSE